VETRVIKVSVGITKTDVRNGVPHQLIIRLAKPSRIIHAVNKILERLLGIDLPLEGPVIRRTAAHRTLVFHFEGQADVGCVTPLDVILTSNRDGQKALKDFQVRDLGVLVPPTVQTHPPVEECLFHGNQVLSRDPLRDLSRRQTGSGARDRATGPRLTILYCAHSPNNFSLCGDGNADRCYHCK